MKSEKTAFITGITGQDGSYLAELLLFYGYEVHGLIRKASTFNTERIDHLYQDPHNTDSRLFLHYGDLTESDQLHYLLKDINPDEVYNLGAQTHVQVSFGNPTYTGNVTGLGTTRLLQAIRSADITPRFYQASSSEIFGNSPPPQSESTPFAPRSPYAAAKLYAYWMTASYREAYGIFAANGILFNHESPRRNETFVTRKITRAVARILSGTQTTLYLGRLDAKRDWGYAPEYVEAMWTMLQQDEPGDFVIGTGSSHTILEFVDAAFGYVGLDWKKHLDTDPKYLRPAEVDHLEADPSKAREQLGWHCQIGFEDLVKIMLDADMESEGITPVGEGRAALATFSDWHTMPEQTGSP